MFKLENLFSVLEEYAPISLSDALVKTGEYDNSGIIVNHHEEVKKILFSLDLSDASVKRAKSLGCDTVITHHPAIYYPIKNLSVFDKTTSPVCLAISKKLNVISMHLNLDIADNGIDACMCKGIGGEKYKILQQVIEGFGYGREFPVKNGKLKDIKARICENFNTKKVVCYGSPNKKIKKVASFCGGGSSFALDYVKKGLTDADLIVTSDMPHHVIKELTEYGKCIILLPHYACEEYGFKEFFAFVTEKVGKKAETYYFDDKRFR